MTGKLLASDALQGMTTENSGLSQEKIDHLRKVMKRPVSEILSMGKWVLAVQIGRTYIIRREGAPPSKAGAKPDMAEAVLKFLRELSTTADSED